MKNTLAFILFWVCTATAIADVLPSVVVRPHAVAVGFPAEAVIEAVQQTTVGAQVPGRILEVRFDAGQAVKKGDVLMRIDAREADEAARAAEAQVANARVNYERTKSLVAQKFMSPAALDKAKADFDAAAANRAAAGASQSHATIVAPMDGIVSSRHAEAGDMATPGKPLFTIFRPGGLRAVASIPQHRLKEMRAVKGAVVEFPELGKWVDATSVQLLPTADTATHVSQVRVALPDVPEATPGMFARVHFATGQAVKLSVPVAAIVRRGEVAAVYVLYADNRLGLRQLRIGDAVGQDEVEVLAGLSAGDRVVTDPVKAGIALKQGNR